MVGLAASLWLYLDDKNQQSPKNATIWVICIMSGIAQSQLQISSLNLTARAISKYSIESSSFVYACMSFIDKTCNGTMILLIQQLCGEDEEEKSEDDKKFFHDILFFTPSAASILIILIA